LTTAAVSRALEESCLFKDLSDRERDLIAPFCRKVVFEAGDVLFREGDPAENIYIVMRGTVAVEVGLLGRQRRRCATIALVRRGEPVGWSAAIGSDKYMASAYAVEKTTAAAIDRKALRLLFVEAPTLGLPVMEKLAELARSRLSSTACILANMLSTASHDLKTHLAAVQSLHQVILGGYLGEMPEQQKGMLSRADDRVRGLVSMIDDIFEMPRVEPCKLQMEPVRLEQIARDSIENARPMAAVKKIELAAELGLELPAVSADRARLEQVLNNLLGNAVKFTHNGGKVTLKITDDNEGREIVIEVMDNGPGICAEELGRIFDDFYRGKDAPIEGAGLGLSNARRIIEAHGGRIRAQSPCPGSGTGSRFVFTLPKATGPDTGEREEMSGHEGRN
jgi:signal transduction histidine kinase